MISKMFSSSNEISKQDLIERGTNKDPIPLMPNETTRIFFNIPFDMFVKLDTDPHYQGLIIEYKSSENNLENIGKIWKIEKGFAEVINHWIDLDSNLHFESK